ncbi:hypothetical protein [Solihabitans fulvus]|uniref:hypothetical protein n=1 Tax=Solihabitans fulvus TaxID=1892852 RepID=UPI00122E68B9|nr:hypothetical protein [Solihabitans fulvus]
MTLCNNSPVDYKSMAPEVLMGHCSCAPNPTTTPEGTLQLFDKASNSWKDISPFAAGLGMDFAGVPKVGQAFPKGTSLTFKYRVSLAATMTAGQGGIAAYAISLPQHNIAGSVTAPVAVVK